MEFKTDRRLSLEDVRESRQVVAKERKAHPLELVKELTDAFKFFDLNGDGKLSVTEMATVMRSLGEEAAEEDLEKLVDGIDGDGDGHLDLDEFIDLNTRSFPVGSIVAVDAELPRTHSEKDALAAAFNKFDADKDGFISAEELHKVLVAFGDDKFSLDECRSMILGADGNGDYLMSLQEFQALMDDHHGDHVLGDHLAGSV